MPDSTLSPDQMRQIADVLRSHDVTRAALFGSFARGSANDQSDVDILVEFVGAKGLLDVATLELELSDRLHRPVEIITYRALKSRIKDHILREQVPVL